METRAYFQAIVLGIELVAVAIIVLGLLWALAHGGHSLLRGKRAEQVYAHVRRNFGRVLLLGLEVLIAADIVKTVAIDLTLQSVGTLGLLVLIRTFLSWAIEIETGGSWPWEQATREKS